MAAANHQPTKVCASTGSVVFQDHRMPQTLLCLSWIEICTGFQVFTQAFNSERTSLILQRRPRRPSSDCFCAATPCLWPNLSGVGCLHSPPGKTEASREEAGLAWGDPGASCEEAGRRGVGFPSFFDRDVPAIGTKLPASFLCRAERCAGRSRPGEGIDSGFRLRACGLRTVSLIYPVSVDVLIGGGSPPEVPCVTAQQPIDFPGAHIQERGGSCPNRKAA